MRCESERERERETHDTDRSALVLEELDDLGGHVGDVRDQGGVRVGHQLGKVDLHGGQARGEALEDDGPEVLVVVVVVVVAAAAAAAAVVVPGLEQGLHLVVPRRDVAPPLHRTRLQLLGTEPKLLPVGREVLLVRVGPHGVDVGAQRLEAVVALDGGVGLARLVVERWRGAGEEEDRLQLLFQHREGNLFDKVSYLAWALETDSRRLPAR